MHPRRQRNDFKTQRRLLDKMFDGEGALLAMTHEKELVVQCQIPTRWPMAAPAMHPRSGDRRLEAVRNTHLEFGPSFLRGNG